MVNAIEYSFSSDIERNISKFFTFNVFNIIFLVLLFSLKYGLPKLSFKISTSLKFNPFLNPVPRALENDSFAANFFEK